MDVRLLRRPIFKVIPGRCRRLFVANTAARRQESTFQRTKKKLNIKPDSSFLYSSTSPQHDHVIFNPPSSAPSVFHTPSKFLPKNDKRRQLAANLMISNAVTSLPPPVVKLQPNYQRHHLSEGDVAEIRRLRATDPETWTRAKLARKFNCSSLFIGICCEATGEKIVAERTKLEEVKARWGPKRRMAREDKVKRREAVYRDE